MREISSIPSWKHVSIFWDYYMPNMNGQSIYSEALIIRKLNIYIYIYAALVTYHSCCCLTKSIEIDPVLPCLLLVFGFTVLPYCSWFTPPKIHIKPPKRHQQSLALCCSNHFPSVDRQFDLAFRWLKHQLLSACPNFRWLNPYMLFVEKKKHFLLINC